MWTDDGLAIIIEGKREDWPGGPRTLTPRASGREPNGRTLWYGAELNPRRPPGVVPDHGGGRLSDAGEDAPSHAVSASSTPSSSG